MKISVITAVLNRQDTIFDTMSSVESQSYQNVEHLIQDGVSTDDTLKIIKKFKSAPNGLVSENDNGIYDAINKGILRSTGDVIGLMHSDDFFAHNRVLEKVAEVFSDPNIDGVYGDLDYVSYFNVDKVVRHWRSGQFRKKELRYGWMPAHPTVYLRREVFNRLGMYDISMKISADYEALLRFIVKGEIRLSYIPDVMVKMRVGGASNNSFSQLKCKMREDLISIKRYNVGNFGTLMLKNLRKLEQFRHQL